LPRGDAFVVGSDQVWNPTITGALHRAYFLDFVPDDIQKISYAASFGTKELQCSREEQAGLSFLLKRFNAISVREMSGLSICRRLADVPAVPTLDPVFLLSDADYHSLCFQVEIKGGGLVCFKFDKGAGFLETVDHMSKALSLPAYVMDRFRARQLLMMPAYITIDRFRGRHIRSILFPSPARWLSSIRQASFIFTDSFHGLAFSLIFRKNFIVTPANPKRFTRIKELLEEIGLESRIFYGYDEIKKDHRWQSPIDYTKVNEIMSRRIESSLDFLRNAL
jgi:hypothetical protein